MNTNKQAPFPQTPPAQSPPLPQTGFLRLRQIIGDKKRNIPALIPVGKSTWWAGVKSGRYPSPIKLSERCVAWRLADILAIGETNGQV